jgi:hypothetical protein
MTFNIKDRVITPHGAGYVLYVRMQGPNYTEVAAYSICLDDKLKASQEPPFPFYNGTIYHPEDVKPE